LDVAFRHTNERKKKDFLVHKLLSTNLAIEKKIIALIGYHAKDFLAKASWSE